MLSMKAKYAIRALMVLGGNEGKMMQSKAIAKDADAPLKFLEAILLDLKNHGLVASKRGIFGGYFLARSAKDIMVGDVVRHIDGMLAPIRCASVNNYEKCEDCVDEHNCTIRHVMIEVRNAISDVLDRKTLADMVRTKKLGKLV
ncbi:MAG: Rrf2 family transcriptional regulator [Rickettsiales bacterium]|nr:Rrf2 family transcriptional regulator [Rickettsiales bacterium]